jgi:hypothetical protein
MNNIAVLPYIGLHALQIQNVKRNVSKKVSVDELNLSNEAKNVVEGKDVVEKEDVVENVSTTTKIDDLPSDKPKNE